MVPAGIVNEYGSVPTQCPGATYKWTQQQAGFIEKNQRGIQATGLFFIRFQSRLVQPPMATSSRCLARRSGL